jgi:hypothetical protein
MNTLLRIFGILAATSLLMSGCGTLPFKPGQEEPVVQNKTTYESMLGKSLTDEVVVDFITGHSCSNADQFLLCNTAGMALWTEANEVETVYLYLNNADGFAPYKGELPFGLKFYDNMAAAEYKLNRHGLGNAGLPDSASIPDRMHYRAAYHQAGLTILYNSPFPDEDANIYAILVSRQDARAKDRP